MTGPAEGRPKHQVVAEELRAAILAGRYADGERLPGEDALMRDRGISRATARHAIRTLQDEGLAVARMGAGVFVRRPMPARRLASDRYQHEVNQIGGTDRPETSFTRDRGIGWEDYRLDKTFKEVPASSELAALLAVAPGTPLLARRFVFYAKGRPEQISMSYLPLDLVAGTPVADPAREPWPGGNIAQLATLGVVVTRVRETVRARPPTADEARTLGISTGVPVFAITRVMLAGASRDRPVEAAVDIVIPADRTVLDYVIDLDPPPIKPGSRAKERKR